MPVRCSVKCEWLQMRTIEKSLHSRPLESNCPQSAMILSLRNCLLSKIDLTALFSQAFGRSFRILRDSCVKRLLNCCSCLTAVLCISIVASGCLKRSNVDDRLKREHHMIQMSSLWKAYLIEHGVIAKNLDDLRKWSIAKHLVSDKGATELFDAHSTVSGERGRYSYTVISENEAKLIDTIPLDNGNYLCAILDAKRLLHGEPINAFEQKWGQAKN